MSSLTLTLSRRTVPHRTESNNHQDAQGRHAKHQNHATMRKKGADFSCCVGDFVVIGKPHRDKKWGTNHDDTGEPRKKLQQRSLAGKEQTELLFT